MHRRDLIQSGAALAAGALLGGAGDPPGPTPFDGATVRRMAQALSKQPYAAPDTGLPGPVDKLTYEQYRAVAFKPDRALWRDGAPFQVQLFPRGFLYRPAVEVFEVAAGQAARVPYSPDLFDWPDPAMRLPDVGFAGFRLHARLNRPDVFTEAVVFLGASYFRAVAKDQVYGLSARGLAIGTGNRRKGVRNRSRSIRLSNATSCPARWPSRALTRPAAPSVGCPPRSTARARASRRGTIGRREAAAAAARPGHSPRSPRPSPFACGCERRCSAHETCRRLHTRGCA